MRTPGGETRGAAAFLDAISQIPGEIVFVKLVALNVDVSGDSAVATGVQHAQVRMEGQTIDDRRPFVDWFVKHEGDRVCAWRSIFRPRRRKRQARSPPDVRHGTRAHRSCRPMPAARARPRATPRIGTLARCQESAGTSAKIRDS